ncbi:magnesium transporter [Enhydrobacter aerosaccus]|uniref:Magnesium transporter MgtE n=1 Tax=Enhydrobacter aerosaccus TaxID=225324 RepID=A0A1T4JYG8_9HYPH|nr:magnesium transporter [Enhydrobacter aerosaccus]SJZ35178.1 magnesium transporter [Enhydrobacter aerosaccus]
MNPQGDLLDEVTPELVRRIEAALDEGRTDQVRGLVADLSPSGQAAVLEQLPDSQREVLVGLLKRELDPEVLTELDAEVRDEVLEQFDSKDIAAAARELETDDAANLLEDLPEEERREVLSELSPADRIEIESTLAYPDESAGRLMQRSLVKVPDNWTIGQVIDHCREADDLPDDVYDLFVVDAAGRLRGSVPLGRMLRTKRPVPILDLVDPDIPSVPVTADQTEVAHLFRDQNLVSCPVVDAEGRLLGVIMVDDVVDVIDEEAEAELLNMGGVGVADMHAGTIRTVRLRGLWLAVNLLTAVIASVVIGQFENAIEKIVALAVLMPIVASMGGNAGTQTVTVAVRALAMGELTAANALRFIAKEVAVGGLNGIIFAALMGTAVVVWYQDWRLGAVIAAALVCNLVAAALSGTLIPLGLQKFGVDPAVSSTVFLTTVTDVTGFLAFLGLATLFLL